MAQTPCSPRYFSRNLFDNKDLHITSCLVGAKTQKCSLLFILFTPINCVHVQSVGHPFTASVRLRSPQALFSSGETPACTCGAMIVIQVAQRITHWLPLSLTTSLLGLVSSPGI